MNQKRNKSVLCFVRNYKCLCIFYRELLGSHFYLFLFFFFLFLLFLGSHYCYTFFFISFHFFLLKKKIARNFIQTNSNVFTPIENGGDLSTKCHPHFLIFVTLLFRNAQKSPMKIHTGPRQSSP